jgi:hypothetical protein
VTWEGRPHIEVYAGKLHWASGGAKLGVIRSLSCQKNAKGASFMLGNQVIRGMLVNIGLPRAPVTLTT